RLGNSVFIQADPPLPAGTPVITVDSAVQPTAVPANSTALSGAGHLVAPAVTTQYSPAIVAIAHSPILPTAISRSGTSASTTSGNQVPTWYSTPAQASLAAADETASNWLSDSELADGTIPARVVSDADLGIEQAVTVMVDMADQTQPVANATGSVTSAVA